MLRAGWAAAAMAAAMAATGATALAQDRAGGGAAGGPAPGVGAASSPFDAPSLAAASRRAAAAIAAGDAAAAGPALAAALARDALSPELHALAAVVAAGRGDEDAAAGHLVAAAALRFRDLPRLLRQQPALAALTARPDVAAALATPPAPPPPPPAAPVRDGLAVVEQANARWSPAEGLIDVAFAFPAAPRNGPPPYDGGAERARHVALLSRLQAQGRAAGNHGDLYDNRDRGHSRLSLRRHPQMTAIAYGAAAQARGLDYGLNTKLRFGAPTIGNSSTALTGRGIWRSQARLAMTEPGAMDAVWRLYAANHLYIYPAHRDYGPERGDLFPASTAAVLVTEGSSGSDRPLLSAAALALAALRPDAKRLLVERGMIAPTLQMLLRRAAAGDDDAAYLDPAAHGPTFPADRLDLDRLIRLANALTPGALPPEARLRAVDLAPARPGIDMFGEGLDEALFDTPAAIARIARAPTTRRYALSAASSRDADGRPLRFRWRVLQGDPARVRLVADGAEASLEVDWHAPFPAPGRPDVETHRVDVAVFADNGAALSAPALFSVAFPPESRRIGADGAVEVARAPRRGRYADPLLFPETDWTDVFSLDADGETLGWTRRRGDVETFFTRDGLRVESRDALGRPARARRVAYPLVVQGERRRVEERDTDAVFLYRYRDAEDRTGVATPEDQ